MEPRVRARALQGLPSVLAAAGGDPRAWFDRFRLPLTDVARDGLVPISRMNALMDAAATELECADFALRLAESEDASILGPLAVAMEASATLSGAIECAGRFMFVHSPAMQVALGEDPAGQPGVVALTYDIVVPGAPYPAQAMELGLALTHRIIELLLSPGYALHGASFPHGPVSPPGRYETFFGAPVAFNQPRACLRLPRELLDMPLARGNEAVRELATAYLASTFMEPDVTTAARVRAAVVDALGAAPVEVTHTARLFNVHPRTLQRQLAAEGTSFDKIVDEVRREAAHRILTTTDLPMSRCASMLGLAEQATLSRAARRWFGVTPTALRRAALVQ